MHVSHICQSGTIDTIKSACLKPCLWSPSMLSQDSSKHLWVYKNKIIGCFPLLLVELDVEHDEFSTLLDRKLLACSVSSSATEISYSCHFLYLFALGQWQFAPGLFAPKHKHTCMSVVNSNPYRISNRARGWCDTNWLLHCFCPKKNTPSLLLYKSWNTKAENYTCT